MVRTSRASTCGRGDVDKREKKEVLRAWREGERATARAAFPIPASRLREMFDMLDHALPTSGCDHTRKLTGAWLEAKELPVDAVFAWLDGLGGFCDCEVLANVEQLVDEALAGRQRR